MGKESYKVAHKKKISPLIVTEINLIDSLRRSMSGCDDVEEIKSRLDSLYEKKVEIDTSIKTKYSQILALDISKGNKINKAKGRVTTLYSGVKKIYSAYDTSIEEGEKVNINLLAKSMVKMKEESYEEKVEQFALTYSGLSKNSMWEGTLQKNSTEISGMEYAALARIYFELDAEEMGKFIGLCYEERESDIDVQYTATPKLKKLLPYVEAGAVAAYLAYLKNDEFMTKDTQTLVTKLLNKYGIIKMLLEKDPIISGKKNKEYWQNFMKFAETAGLYDCTGYNVSFKIGGNNETISYNFDLSTGCGKGGSEKIASALHSAIKNYVGDATCSTSEAATRNLLGFAANLVPGIGYVSGGLDLAQEVKNASQFKALLDSDLYNQLSQYFDFVVVSNSDSKSGENVSVQYVYWDKNLSKKVDELNEIINDVIESNLGLSNKYPNELKRIAKKYHGYLKSTDSTKCDIDVAEVTSNPQKVLDFCKEFIN